MQPRFNVRASHPLIDFEHLHALLRSVGAELKATFDTLGAIHANDGMMATFKVLDARTAEAIRVPLSERYPDIAWQKGEFTVPDAGETSEPHVAAARYWICDAIDGAVQFLRAIPHWCITIALIENGATIFAAIYDPNRDEMFEAVRDAGAFLNGERIAVNGRASHLGALLANSQPPFIQDNLAVIDRSCRSLALLLAEAGAVRNLGPTSLQLAYVACGRLDGFWEFGEDTFNCIGGALMVEMAGGRVSDAEGNAYGLRAQSIIAAPAGVRASIVARFMSLDVAHPA
jgi:myo-inositol-1(or 4)-monophosphatase